MEDVYGDREAGRLGSPVVIVSLRMFSSVHEICYGCAECRCHSWEG